MKMISTLLLLVAAFAVQAQVTLESLISTPFPTELTASKNGERIAWVFNDRGMRNIWVAEAPEFKARKLTQNTLDDGQEISALSFVAQGDKLIFVKGSAPNGQNELPNPLALQEGIEYAIYTINWNGEQKKLASGSYPKISPDGKTVAFLSGGQVWTIPVDGSKDGKKLFHSRGAQSALRWSPDGSKLAFVSKRGDHDFIGVYDLTAATVQYLDPSIDHDSDPVWSPEGKRIAFIRTPHVRNSFFFTAKREGYPWSIRIVELGTGKATEIWKALPGRGSVLHNGIPAIDNLLFWADDRIVFPWEGDGWVHLYALPVKGGEPVLLTPGNGEVEQVSISSDNKSFLYSTNIGDPDRRHLWKVSTSGGKPQQLSTGPAIEWSAVETSEGIGCFRSDAVTGGWPHLISADGKINMLAQDLFPSGFPKNSLVIPQAVTITAKDGMKIPAQLFVPKNHKTGDKHPAVIFFHGGSRRQMLLGFHYGLYYHNAYVFNQYLASLGYIVLSVNYRSGIGYGLEFREALDYGAGGNSEYNDVIGAGLYLKQRPDVDGKKIGLWGGSYGGYLTALGLSRSADLFACGVDMHGVHDWNVVIKNFVPAYQPEKYPVFAKKAFESSPMNFVDGWRAPVLFIHGDDDRNVPFSETVSLAEQLRRQNVYFEQLIFPDEVHSFLLHKSWVKAYDAAADFFKRQFER